MTGEAMQLEAALQFLAHPAGHDDDDGERISIACEASSRRVTQGVFRHGRLG